MLGFSSRRSATLDRQTRGALWNRKTIIRLTPVLPFTPACSVALVGAFDRPLEERSYDAAHLAGEASSRAVSITGIEDRERHRLVLLCALEELRRAQRTDGDVDGRGPLLQEIRWDPRRRGIHTRRR